MNLIPSMTTQAVTPVPAAPLEREFASLPETERRSVRRWTEALAQVAPPIVPALQAVAVQLGCSYSTARRKYYGWLAAGRSWAALVDRTQIRDERDALDPALIDEWQRRFCENQRKGRPAYRKLVRDFFAGMLLPGVPEGWDRQRGLPPGWSYNNLMRYQPSRFTTAAMRQGRAAAADFRPLVYTTREDLWAGSHYLFDDLWHDLMVNVLDTRQTGRPLEFHCLDLYSACKVGWGFRVRTENAVTGRMEGLREENMRWLVTQVLADHGYDSERGTTLVVEHGTAAIRPEFEALLREVTAGHVKVERSGMQGDPAFVGQYGGRAKGNFRFKAALESIGNLIHNELADLPGQTGMSVERRPEALHGLLRHNDALLDAMVALRESRPELADLLRLPLISHTQFGELLLEVYGRMNRRTDHRLEGWSRQVAPAEDGLTMRRLSPWEVWQRGRARLTRLSPAAQACLLWTESGATARRVSGGRIEIWEKELSTDVIRYDASALTDGESYSCIVNPFSPSVLWAYDARGAFVAACPVIARGNRAELASLHRAMGAANRREAQLLQDVARVGREITRQRVADARHNAGILEAAAGLPEARAAQRLAARAAAAGAEMAETLSAPRVETEVPDEFLDCRVVEPQAEEPVESMDVRDR